MQLMQTLPTSEVFLFYLAVGTANAACKRKTP
jgi:hypothetical protein